MLQSYLFTTISKLKYIFAIPMPDIHPLLLLLLPELALVAGFLVAMLCLPTLKSKKLAPWVCFLASGGGLVAELVRASVLQSETALPYLHVVLAPWQEPFLFVVHMAGLLALGWVCLEKNEDTDTEAGFIALSILAALLGAHMLILANTPVMSVLSLELLSIASYAGVAWGRGGLGLDAALRYVLLGVFSSACLIYGLSWAYGLALVPPSDASAVATLAVEALLVVGVLFKLGAFPLHGWVPGVYEKAPLPFVAFLSVAPKVAALGWVSHLVVFSHGTLASVALPLGVLGAASVLAGNVGAFFQPKFMRLMAFSSVAHAGFMLLCLASHAPLEVAGFYSLALLGINFMAFGLWGHLQRMGAGPALATVNGWARGRFWLAALAVVSALALAGLPPTVGFIAKFKLVLGLANQAAFFGKGWAYGLAGFVAFNTALSLYYYLRLPYHLIFKVAGAPPVGAVTKLAKGSLLLLAVLLLFFFFAGQLLELFLDS